ncbi:carboxymuconolactone decarboxylase family protein [Xylocopilactobacillus apicola]|uniref:Carboxymuconolactone decarboxylase n=1 Tax=Xylocopilactobacillus apicola TaxID=2932184 RepID=A0AAU9CY07_9LACO|nr:carboxymuconolactone decarboxylase family protein [Xylocopilactobacillus apicola]BDR58912.1 carboxymuconolactone decarboxylase [Xylocopilactobacillus apicola]
MNNEAVENFNELSASWLNDVDVHCAAHLENDRLIIPLIAGTVQGVTDQIKDLTKKALAAQIKPEVIVEVIYQLAPVAGILRVKAALSEIQQVFDEENLTLPPILVEEDPEFGAKVQAEIYGTEIKNLLKDLPAKAGNFIPQALTEHFFNDFYGRKVLSVKERERYELLALITLNVDFQIKAHARGSLKAGNSEAELIWSVIQLLPYVGFPFVVNSVQIIHQAAN